MHWTVSKIDLGRRCWDSAPRVKVITTGRDWECELVAAMVCYGQPVGTRLCLSCVVSHFAHPVGSAGERGDPLLGNGL